MSYGLPVFACIEFISAKTIWCGVIKVLKSPNTAMSTYRYAAYDTFDTMAGVENDVFAEQKETDFQTVRPVRNVSPEELMKKKYKVDHIPKEKFEELLERAKGMLGLGMHPLRKVRMMYEEEMGDSDERAPSPVEEDKETEKGGEEGGSKLKKEVVVGEEQGTEAEGADEEGAEPAKEVPVEETKKAEPAEEVSAEKKEGGKGGEKSSKGWFSSFW